MASDSRIGELLLREKLITPLQLQQAMQKNRDDGGRLTFHLTKMGFIDETELTAFLSKQYGVPSVNLSDFEIEAEVLALVPRDVVVRHQCVPISRTGQNLIIALADPSNIYAIDDVKFLTGYNVDVVVASEHAIEEAIGKYYSQVQSSEGGEVDAGDFSDIIADYQEAEDVDFDVGEEEPGVVDLEQQAEGAPVVKLVNLVLLDAIKKHASDIHIEAYEKEMRVRFRIDGVLYEIMKPPLQMKNAILSRIKIMSQLDIAERRLPQDGRIKLKYAGGKEMDFRVSILPTLWGEKAVLRLLDKSNLQLDLTKLGFDESELGRFHTAIENPYGMILVTGPTGSGKTTTLYSVLSELNKTTENICTAEDPVEFNLTGINQVQMQDSIGLNFASALRSFLRQDPDIILVGEIRDFETAEIGVKAALTGHLVLSTLHTNDAPSTISRLLNMGIEPFLVGSAVILIAAQRLVRKVCTECKVQVEGLTPQHFIDLQVSPERAETMNAYKGTGCSNCNNTGYKGRVAAYEIMPMTDELKDYVLNGASTLEVKKEAIREGMLSLRMAALRKMELGQTTIEEVLRVTAPD